MRGGSSYQGFETLGLADTEGGEEVHGALQAGDNDKKGSWSAEVKSHKHIDGDTIGAELDLYERLQEPKSPLPALIVSSASSSFRSREKILLPGKQAGRTIP